MDATNHGVATFCAQCGAQGVGRFCGDCGSPLTLDEESISAEIRSKFTTPAVSLLSFLKTTWLVLASPRAFFTSYVTGSPPLSSLAFPLTRLWSRWSSKPQKVMGPFRSLAMAIGLVACVAFLEDWSWRITGFSERVFGMSRAQMLEKSEQNLRAFYESQFRRPLTIVDTTHLTGLALVDGPVHEIICLLQYMYFPLVVSVFLVGRSIRRSTLVHHYVYAVSSSLAIFFLFHVLGLILFVLLQGVSPDAALGLSGLPVIVGYVSRIYFLVFLPIAVLPRILPVTRGRVVVATLVGTVVCIVANLMLSELLLFKLGVVWK
jgi:hypothetical protein